MTEPKTQPVPDATPEAVAVPTTAVDSASVPTEDHSTGFWNSVQWLLSVVVIAVFVMTFVVQAFEIPSDSMERTLLVGDYLLVDKVAFGSGGIWGPILPYRQLKRGDIVVFRYPVHPEQHFVKRVIGIPGDRLHLSNKQVWVNGKPIIEDYTTFKSTQRDRFRDDFPTNEYISGNVDTKWWLQMKKLTEDGKLIVPESHYFVMGDNRDDSLDSRYWGFVPQENVVGRPLLIYWSVERENEDADEENGNPNATLSRVSNGFLRMFRNARWKRAMTIVY